MIRFVLRLVGALLVEKLLRDRSTYFHGIRIHPRNTIPTSGRKYTLEIPRGTFKCKPASASGILPFSPIYEELPADFAPGYRVTRQGATMHFTSTDPGPHWKDE